MKYLIGTILMILITLDVYGQDVTINTGIYKSKIINMSKSLPSTVDFKNGHGIHLNIEYNKIEYSSSVSQIFGLEWRRYDLNMSLLMKEQDQNQNKFLKRNGMYSFESVSVQHGFRQIINTKKSLTYQFDFLVFLLANYKARFKGDAYNWTDTEVMGESNNVEYVLDNDLSEHSPLQFGATIRGGVYLPLNKNRYLNIQGFVSSSLWSSIIYKYQVIDLGMLNYGITIGLTFEKKTENP